MCDTARLHSTFGPSGTVGSIPRTAYAPVTSQEHFRWRSRAPIRRYGLFNFDQRSGRCTMPFRITNKLYKHAPPPGARAVLATHTAALGPLDLAK